MQGGSSLSLKGHKHGKFNRWIKRGRRGRAAHVGRKLDLKIGYLNIRGGRKQSKWEMQLSIAREIKLAVVCVSETHLLQFEEPQTRP